MLVSRSLFTTPKSSFRSPAQTSSERKPGTAYGMTSSERYVRRKRSSGLSSAIARKRPSANEKKTQSVAKMIVQKKTRMNGSRTSGSVTSRLKLARPTWVFQPGSSSSPFSAANEPWPLSVKTRPSLIRVKVSVAAS